MQKSEYYDLQEGYVYDPVVKGADTTFWKAISGAMSVSSNKLRLNATRIASYVQQKFARAIFAVNVPTNPAASDTRVIGLRNPAAPTVGSAYFDFDSDGVFSAISYDMFGNRERTTITWDSDWSGSETRYEIIQQHDLILFKVGEDSDGTVVKAAHKTRLGDTPLALEVNNANADNLDIGYIEVRRAQNVI